MYLLKNRKTGKDMVLCRTLIALEVAEQFYSDSGVDYEIVYTDTVTLIDPMEQ
jgi:hypothetical protein